MYRWEDLEAGPMGEVQEAPMTAAGTKDAVSGWWAEPLIIILDT